MWGVLPPREDTRVMTGRQKYLKRSTTSLAHFRSGFGENEVDTSLIADWRFAQDKNLRDRVGRVLITLIRASLGWAFDAGFSLTEHAIDVARFDHLLDGTSLGLRVEAASINEIRNSTMVNAVAGSPGARPTNWVLDGTLNSIDTIPSIGTLNGMEFIDVRFNGTPLGSGVLNFEQNNQITTAQNEEWSGSLYVQLVGGDFTNINNMEIRIRERGGASTPSNDTAIIITPTLQRFSSTYTITQADTIHVEFGLRVNYDGSGDIDFTLRIFQPQMEKQPFVLTPIKTSTVAVTRAKDIDNASLTLDEHTVVISGRTPLGSPASGVEQVLWQSDDGTANERTRIIRNSSNEMHGIVTVGGSDTADLNLGTVADDTDFNVALSVATNDIGGVLDGVAATRDTSAAIPNTTTERPGMDHNSTNQWMGTIARSRKFSGGLVDAEMQDLAP